MLRQIKASAGSGKTHDLTRHFLDLLVHARPAAYLPSCSGAGGRTSEPYAWGDILAVTFTNRAAVEMKERVVKRLKEAALGKDPLPPPWTPALAASWVGRIIRQHGTLNIRTIDSLLQQMVAASALELGLPPEFSPVYTSVEAVAPYLDSLMEHARQGDEELGGLLRECCRSLLFHTSYKGFLAGSRLTARIASLLDYALLHGLPENVGPEALEGAIAALTHEYGAAACEMSRVLEEEDLSAHKNFLALLARAPELNVKPSAYLGRSGIEECLTGASAGRASQRAQNAYVRLCSAAGDLARQGRILRLALEKLPFVRLASRLLADFTEGQRFHDTLPAIRIPELARRSMDSCFGVSALLCRLGSRLMHILIDEFQDTSRAQWEALRPLALEALAQGGSLTWVGDVKQAIYNWRGGDAALFDALLRDQELRRIAPEPECRTLPSNWRSREEIVKFNNALFSLLATPERALRALERLLPEMPPEFIGEAAGDLRQTFTAAGQLLPDRPASRGGFVRIVPVEGENAAELESLAHAELERSIMETAARRAWKDMAILARSNRQAASIAAMLMGKGVPVLTENSLILAEHPLVQQSIAFLRFIHNPSDEKAFWEICTAPPCAEQIGLSWEYLHDWAAGRAAGDLHLCFRDAFPDAWAKLFAPFFPCGLATPYDLLQEFFSHTGIMERFPEGAAFLRRLLEVVHAAEGRGYASPASFLDKWAQGGMEEKLPMPEGMDAVRVMTIHKAKGLEFPVVFIPGTHFSLQIDNPATEVSLRLPDAGGAARDTLLLAARCREMGAAYYQAMAADAREMLHVLYVAFTRATDELHVFLTKNASSWRRKNISALLEMLLPEIGVDIGREYVRGAPRVVNPASAAAPPGEMPDNRQTGGAAQSVGDPCRHPMIWLTSLRIDKTLLSGKNGISPETRGMLLHKSLEYLIPTGQAREDAERAVSLGAHALRVRLDPEQRDDLTNALAWYAALPQAAFWMARGSAEQSLLDAENRLHRMDMLVDDGEGYTVLEYKSGQAYGWHTEQLRRYLVLLERACGRPARGVLIYLDLRLCRCVTPTGKTKLLEEPAEWI